MLATIRVDTWNVLNMHYITPNKKDGIIETSPGGHKEIKGPDYLVEGGHHLRRAPSPHPQDLIGPLDTKLQ